MSKKHKVPLGLQQEFNDVDYWHKLDNRKKIYSLGDGTKLTEYEYMKRFMHEHYGNKFDRHDDSKNILKTEKQKKEARRNHNNTHRDALLVSKKMGALKTLFQVEKTQYNSETEKWEDTFKVGSYEDALKDVVQHCCDDFDIEYTNMNVRKILKTYFRLTKYVKLVRVDIRTQKKGKKK